MKRNIEESRLTQEQKQSLQNLKDKIHDSKLVNLYGEKKVGKTFLAWVLAKNSNFEYFPSVNDADFSNKRLIIDNGGRSRNDARELRKVIKLNDVEKVIYLTRGPAKEVYPRVNLEASNDREDILASLAEIGYEFTDIKEALVQMRK